MIHSVHEDIIPLNKSFYIRHDVSIFNQNDQSKLYIASLYGYKKKPNYLTSTLRKKSSQQRQKI